MEDEKKIPRRSSKKDRSIELLAKLAEWQKNGDTPEEAVERLTMAQYDFLIDYGINLDDFVLTAEQQKAVSQITKAPRTCKPSGYDKKYPQTKIDLYNALISHLEEMGATITPLKKENFRNIDFTLENIGYSIVLSNPRTKKD